MAHVGLGRPVLACARKVLQHRQVAVQARLDCVEVDELHIQAAHAPGTRTAATGRTFLRVNVLALIVLCEVPSTPQRTARTGWPGPVQHNILQFHVSINAAFAAIVLLLGHLLAGLDGPQRRAGHGTRFHDLLRVQHIPPTLRGPAEIVARWEIKNRLGDCTPFLLVRFRGERLDLVTHLDDDVLTNVVGCSAPSAQHLCPWMVRWRQHLTELVHVGHVLNRLDPPLLHACRCEEESCNTSTRVILLLHCGMKFDACTAASGLLVCTGVAMRRTEHMSV
eukprot:CAMPEP_0117545194 /NCGR_PEP_ID=MMETSP0784-20121206/45969_1 /TAXON_ID=39447 /ORGANISM="" /LENGTH=278 /DNA_ID=CAMNT_0005342033 /DNA_START=507 /DNA_END=1341 /DNA_ORIENTATION=+